MTISLNLLAVSRIVQTALAIHPIEILEAKDFLVRQTAEQAALENVPLSDLEKRMMYFTPRRGVAYPS